MAAYQNLAQEIIKAIESGGTNHPATVANAITNYLIQNTLITVNYSGTIPGAPPLPDPIVVDTLKISGVCAPLVNTDINSYIQSINSNISTGFMIDIGLAGVMPMGPTLAFIAGLELTQDDIKSAHLKALSINSTTPNIIIWEEISKKIIEWLKKCNIGLSFAAQNTNSGSTGNATVVKTEIL